MNLHYFVGVHLADGFAWLPAGGKFLKGSPFRTFRFGVTALHVVLGIVSHPGAAPVHNTR